MSLILLLLFTTSLVSCGQQGKTSAKLEVSQSFIVDSSKFGGGLIITGESTTGKKFTFALDNSRGASVELDQGSWTFTAVAWEGNGANNFKFEGTTYCGISQANLNSAEANVTISVSSTNCSGTEFMAKAPVKQIRPLACGMFYSYTAATNAYTPITSATPDNFCESGSSIPDEFMNPYAYYRVISSHGINGNANAGFESECKGVALNSLNLPSKTIPFFIRLYKTASDCTNKVVNTPVYHFPNGLEAGNPAKFDHHFYDLAAVPNSRLVLPTSITKRGRSPFMNMIPSILCGSSGSYTDCLPNPTLTASVEEDVHLSFNDGGDEDRQLILRDVPYGSSCPTTYLNNMNLFSAKDCEIEDGNAYASFSRNNLTCQESNDFSSAKDIYYANDKIYILSTSGADSYIKAYDLKGNKIREVKFTSTTLVSIAVDASDAIYSHTVTTIYKTVYNSSNNTFSTTTVDNLNFTAMQHIEVNSAGTNLFVAGTKSATTGIHPAVLSPYAIGTAVSISGSIKELQYVSTSAKLYFSLTTSGTDIRTLDWSGSALSSNTIVQSSIGSWVATHKSGSDLYWVTTTDIYKNGSSVSSSTFASSGAMVIADSKIYVLNNVGGSANLKVFNSTYSSIHNVSGVCSESGANTTITIGSKSRILHIKAKSDDSVYRIWESGFEFLGRRNIVDTTDSLRYYFRQLNPHGDEVTNGGFLRRPQQMLSPTGISGFFSDFATCEDLATAVAAAGANGIARSQTLFDASTGQFKTYGVTAKQNVSLLDSYLCKDNTSSGTCNSSSDKFSLELSFGAMNTSDVDDSVLKISCSRQLGTMESMEFSDGELRRELLKWNTGNTVAARYEVYSLDDQSNEDRASIIKFEKVTNASSFVARQISATHRSGEVEANIKEYQLGSTEAEFKFRQAHLKDTSVSNFLSNGHSTIQVINANDFDTVKSLTNFGSYLPAYCLDTSTTSTQGNPDTCAAAINMSTLPSAVMSEGSGFDLSTIDMIDFTNSGHPLQDGSVFEIPDP